MKVSRIKKKILQEIFSFFMYLVTKVQVPTIVVGGQITYKYV